LIRWAIFIFTIWASSTVAAIETWPALYDVKNVAADDVLNVRSMPNASAEIIGTLPFDATNIEVVEVDDERLWARVNISDGSGWVSLRFMEKHPRWAGSFPPITACFGAEPFWDLTHTPNQTELRDSGDTLERVSETYERRSQVRSDHFGMIIGNSRAFLTENQCSDGMSDNVYGLTIDIFTQIDGNPALLSGCCTIQPR